MYTLGMHTLPCHSPVEVQTLASETKVVSGLVIDWTQLELGDSASRQATVHSLIRWVENFPRQQAIHVYLPSVSDRVSARRLQSALQTLGCTVTRKLHSSCIR